MDGGAGFGFWFHLETLDEVVTAEDAATGTEGIFWTAGLAASGFAMAALLK